MIGTDNKMGERTVTFEDVLQDVQILAESLRTGLRNKDWNYVYETGDHLSRAGLWLCTRAEIEKAYEELRKEPPK